MAKDKQPRKPRAETPKGFRDYFGADVTERKAMLDRIAEIYHLHGFEPLETSAVETVEVSDEPMVSLYEDRAAEVASNVVTL